MLLRSACKLVTQNMPMSSSRRRAWWQPQRVSLSLVSSGLGVAAAQVLYCADPLIAALLASGAQHYLEFKLVQARRAAAPATVPPPRVRWLHGQDKAQGAGGWWPRLRHTPAASLSSE